MDPTDARLLPRYRRDGGGGVVDLRRRSRAQAAALVDGLDRDPDARLPLRHQLTKPGDPEALRGIPAIGRSVTGAMHETSPERETLRRLTRAEVLREKTQEAA